MLILVIGGWGSGKSVFIEKRLPELAPGRYDLYDRADKLSNSDEFFERVVNHRYRSEYDHMVLELQDDSTIPPAVRRNASLIVFMNLPAFETYFHRVANDMEISVKHVLNAMKTFAEGQPVVFDVLGKTMRG